MTAAHQIVPAGLGSSTILPDMDFETYSEAGFIWNEVTQSYGPPKGATKKGIFAVGAAVYAQHPSAEVLLLAYDLKDGYGPRQWRPGLPAPVDLFEYLARGGLIEAWNCNFEYWIWTYVCVPKYGWPPINWYQLRDAMAKSRAHAWPGALANAGKVSGATFQKLSSGTNLINFFSCPRKPTKNNPSNRNMPDDHIAKFAEYCDYNLGDIKAEAAVSRMCPNLNPEEELFELHTRLMNIRGVAVDTETVTAACSILDQAYAKYDSELCALTEREVRLNFHRVCVGDEAVSCLALGEKNWFAKFRVQRASERDKLVAWLNALYDLGVKSLDKEAIVGLLARPDLPPAARRALEIRQLVGAAGPKKYYAMDRMKSLAGRLHDLIIYHAARTGRDAGQDVQPQNLVKQGVDVLVCESCGHAYGVHLSACPWPGCGASSELSHKRGWSAKYAEDVIAVIRRGSLDLLEHCYGDALLALSGCIRGMFVAGPECDLVCSDFSSIEAVITAVLAGCRWRIEAFQRKEDIYLRSVSKSFDRPYEEYVQYAEVHSHKHPDRSKIGKPSELGLGFGGWIGAWRKFDKSDTFSDQEVKDLILKWREASPEIVELWGGQVRGKPWAPDYYERYGLEGAALNAVEYPGRCFESHGIVYGVKDDVLYCRLPSGRYLTYHKPRLSASNKWEGQLSLSFEGWNSNPEMGATGWVRIHTYGGRLAENVIQAIARDILREAVKNLEQAGYPVVMRVHDELVCEVPQGFGSVEEVERLMGIMPEWATGWPIRATEGWIGKRYRKD